MALILNDLRLYLIRLAYSRWEPERESLERGYTILLPTPADLPVFFDIALKILNNQDHTFLKEIIVIPDWPIPQFERYVAGIGRTTAGIPVRCVRINSLDKMAWRLTKSITTRHFTQLVRGVDALTTTHAIIHDSDLFLRPGDFLLRQYLACRDAGLNVYGLDIRRSLARFDRKEFVATWEMTFSTEWFRSFPPYQHKGQVTVVQDRRQEFDTTLLPQYLSNPESIRWIDRSNEYFHFNYVIASYRNYTNRRRYVPEYSLKLFLIRTLVDAFDRSGWEYKDLPRHEDFIKGSYGIAELANDEVNGPKTINEFKSKVGGILESDVFSAGETDFIRQRYEMLLESIGVPF